MKLTANFSLSEFTKSQIAIQKGISNKPSKKVIENLTRLCTKILQPLRDAFDAWEDTVVVINSGYRSPKLNQLIGGSTTSQHCKGEAADIEVPGQSNLHVAQWIKDNLEFDQLILEFHTKNDPSSGWVHVSIKKSGNRKQVLRAVKVGRKTKYLKGFAR